MMRSPLIQILVETHRYPVLTEANVIGFLQEHKDVVLFFSENPQQFHESNDVAVILPELIRLFDGRLIPAVVDESIERSLYKRFSFDKWPALVFLRNNEYVGVVTGMQDWAVFMQEFERMLAAPVCQAPTVTIPLHIASH